MKKLVAFMLMLFCVTVRGDDPHRTLRVDLNRRGTPFSLEAWQGESVTYRVYLYQDGETWIPSTNSYGGLMGFGTNYADSSSMSLATGQMTTATNYLDFSFTESKLNTNGIFYAQVMVTNSTGGKWVFNEGNWKINKSPITGSVDPLALSYILNWDLYSFLGTPPYVSPTNSQTYTATNTAQAAWYFNGGFYWYGTNFATLMASWVDQSVTNGILTAAKDYTDSATQGLVTASITNAVLPLDGTKAMAGNLDIGDYALLLNTNPTAPLRFGSFSTMYKTNIYGQYGMLFNPGLSVGAVTGHDLFTWSTDEGLFLSSIGVNGEMFLHGTNYISMSVGDVVNEFTYHPIVALDGANSIVTIWTGTNVASYIDLGANGYPLAKLYTRQGVVDMLGNLVSNAIFYGNGANITGILYATTCNVASNGTTAFTNYIDNMATKTNFANMVADGNIGMGGYGVTNVGMLTTTGSVGVGNADPLAPLHVGGLATENSVDSQILISRRVSDSIAGNGHAFSDSSWITRTGTIGYASYDARVSITGSNNYDHYVAYQAAPNYSSTAIVSEVYSFASVPTIVTGRTTSLYGLYCADPASNGVVVSNYGVYISELTRGANNYAFYSAGLTPSYFGGPTGLGTNSPKYVMDIRSTNTGTAGLRVTGGGSVGAYSQYSGMLWLGDNASAQGYIIYNGSAGDMIFGNTYAVNTGEFYFQLKSGSAAPLTPLVIATNGLNVSGGVYSTNALTIGAGTNLLTLGQDGPVVITGTNFFFYNSATNWAGSWADYTGYYHGINSNGAIRVLTNAWGW